MATLKNNKAVIIQNIMQSKGALKETVELLKIENSESQFDYCTSSVLSNELDELLQTVRRIERIVYQN